MNKIEAIGTLRDGGKEYKQGRLYLLDVPRRSDTVDTLMVFADEELPLGPMKVTGTLQSGYIHKLGVPTYIQPETVEVLTEAGEVLSDASVEGRLKKDPVCRKTKKGKSMCTILVVTDDGTVPVLLWGTAAEEAPGKYRAGDRLLIKGRLQSREYPAKDGSVRTAWELSARKVAMAKEEGV